MSPTPAPTDAPRAPTASVAPPRTVLTTQGWAALISVLAGSIHLAVAPEHLEEWWVFGTFFIATGLFQLAFVTPLLRRPTPLVALTGIAVNLGIVLIWVLSRTAGLPIAPPGEAGAVDGGHAVAGPIPLEGAHPVEPSHGVEPVGPADLVATGAELLLICLLVTLLPTRMRGATGNAMLVTGMCLWALRLSGALG